MLDDLSSVTLCFLFSGLYVLSLYLIPVRLRRLPRDDAAHIKARMLACSGSTVITVGIIVYYYESIKHQSYLHHLSLWEALGLRFEVQQAIVSVSMATLLMCVFYAGPLLSRCWIIFKSRNHHIDSSGHMTKLSPDAMERVKRRGGGGWWYGVRAVVFSNVQVLSINNMASFRNHVFAPISEEFVFRSIIVLLMLAKYRLDAVNSTTHTVAWEIARMCPLWFGVAHMHHAIEKVAKIGMPVKIVLMQTLVQLTYTSVFGYMACLLLLRTGTVIAPITSHMICNFMGLPDVGFIFAPGHSSSSEMSALHTYRIVITAVHLGGLVSFAYLLCPLTESLVESSALWSLRAAPALSV